MTNTSGTTSCATRSWRVAGCGGIAVLIILVALGITGFFAGLILGAIVAVGLGVFLSRFMCPEAETAQEQPQAQAAPVADTPVETAPEPVAAPEPEPAPEPTPDPEPANEVTEPRQAAASASSRVKPSKTLPGQVELASRKGTWKYEGPSASA